MMPIISSSIFGTTIEWYDFFLYGTVATIVFPHLFFPQANAFVGTLLSLTTLLVGFIARPIGAVLFGHLGDRLGRKSTLVATLLCTGIGTFAIGLVPGYNTIGVAAPILISLLRFLQGISVGGEWGGSILLTIEHGDAYKRGYWAGWPQIGLPMGLVLSSIAVAIFQGVMPDQFNTWGWRIPFLLSALLIIIGLYIRLRILETPVFQKIQQEQNIAKAPLIEAFVKNWKQIFCSMGAKLIEQAPLYIFQTFLIIYAGTNLHVSKQLLLIGIGVGAFLEMFTIPLFSSLSDRIGRRRLYFIGVIVMVLYVFPYFLLLNTRNSALVLLSIILSFALCHAMLWGPEAALIAEQFRTRFRYSGASVGAQLAAPLSGGIAPIIAVALLQGSHGTFVPVALFMIAIAIISALALLGLKERSHENIAD
jgi:MFS family permease